MFLFEMTADGSAAMPPASPVPDWLQIAVAGASLFGSVSVVVAVAAFWIQWFRGREERKERKLELAALQRAEDDRIAAQARKVVPEIASSALFGENIWLAHIKNASTGAIGQLKVVVKAYDDDNNEIADGIRKATGELNISGGMQRIISDALSGGVSGVVGANPIIDMLQSQQFGAGQQAVIREHYKRAIGQQVGPQVSRVMSQALIGQLQKNWPPSLGPGGETSVAYRATRAGLHMNIGIAFEDEAGYLWFRVNTEQPKRLEPEVFGAMRHEEMKIERTDD